jgi:hypothetical protein
MTDDRGDRLAGAELVAVRGERTPGEQRPANAVDLGKRRKLQGRQHSAGDDQWSQPEAPRRREHQRPDRKAAGNDQCDRGEHNLGGHAGAQQIRRKERAAAAHRQRVNGVMQVEQVDGVVAKEGHGPDVSKVVCGRRVANRALYTGAQNKCSTLSPSRESSSAASRKRWQQAGSRS